MINYTTYKIDCTTNNELNYRFSFISFSVSVLSLLKSIFDNLFSVKTLQIQFYNFLGIDLQNQSQTEQDNENKDPFSIQLVDSFDTILFLRDFKIPI